MCARSISYVLLTCILAGCANSVKEEEIPEPETVVEESWTPMYEYTESIVFNNKLINAITPCSHMEIVGEELHIFPYFDYDEYISMKIIVLSGNDMYTQSIKTLSDDKNFKVDKKRAWFYKSTNGTTVGIYKIDSETAYYIETSKFPSSYVELVLDELNKQKDEGEEEK